MFGKTMSIPDTLLSKYVHLVTDLSLEEQAMDRDLENGVLHPRDAKIFLGRIKSKTFNITSHLSWM
ncbi:hypothetical protein Q73_00400 [Bacillus coahuilensis m2-6]|nr:hypothetical protein Q73_00400 [Bacillus coahuilensis m2-6]